MLFSDAKFEKSNCVTLKTARPKAIIMRIIVKIFILLGFYFDVKLINDVYTNKSLTFPANNLTAIASSITPKVLRTTPKPFFPSSLSIFDEDLSTA